MPTNLSEPAIERSTYVIALTPKDETATAVTPNIGTVTWTLTDYYGNIINSRSNVALASAATMYIVLTDEDLAVVDESPVRRVTIQCEYNSSLGNNLSLRDEVRFNVVNLDKVT